MLNNNIRTNEGNAAAQPSSQGPRYQMNRGNHHQVMNRLKGRLEELSVIEARVSARLASEDLDAAQTGRLEKRTENLQMRRRIITEKLSNRAKKAASCAERRRKVNGGLNAEARAAKRAGRKIVGDKAEHKEEKDNEQVAPENRQQQQRMILKTLQGRLAHLTLMQANVNARQSTGKSNATRVARLEQRASTLQMKREKVETRIAKLKEKLAASHGEEITETLDLEVQSCGASKSLPSEGVGSEKEMEIAIEDSFVDIKPKSDQVPSSTNETAEKDADSGWIPVESDGIPAVVTNSKNAGGKRGKSSQPKKRQVARPNMRKKQRMQMKRLQRRLQKVSEAEAKVNNRRNLVVAQAARLEEKAEVFQHQRGKLNEDIKQLQEQLSSSNDDADADEPMSDDADEHQISEGLDGLRM